MPTHPGIKNKDHRFSLKVFFDHINMLVDKAAGTLISPLPLLNIGILLLWCLCYLHLKVVLFCRVRHYPEMPIILLCENPIIKHLLDITLDVVSITNLLLHLCQLPGLLLKHYHLLGNLMLFHLLLELIFCDLFLGSSSLGRRLHQIARDPFCHYIRTTTLVFQNAPLGRHATYR